MYAVARAFLSILIMPIDLWTHREFTGVLWTSKPALNLVAYFLNDQFNINLCLWPSCRKDKNRRSQCGFVWNYNYSNGSQKSVYPKPNTSEKRNFGKFFASIRFELWTHEVVFKNTCCICCVGGGGGVLNYHPGERGNPYVFEKHDVLGALDRCNIQSHQTSLIGFQY